MSDLSSTAMAISSHIVMPLAQMRLANLICRHVHGALTVPKAGSALVSSYKTLWYKVCMYQQLSAGSQLEATDVSTA